MILLPFAWLYGLLMRLRNLAFDLGWKKSHRVDTYVVSVGNLSMGGTGKTPMIEALVKILGEKYNLGMASRGYQRQTKGLHLAESEESAATLGDEPFQLFRKFKDLAIVVDADRTTAVKYLLEKKGRRDIVLLDDAFQHRSIHRDLNIMLTTYSEPFFADHVLPAGNLREPRVGAKRADAIVVTKCPEELSKDESNWYTNQIKMYAPKAKVFFSYLAYEELQAVIGQRIKKDIIVLSGIAQPHLFVQALHAKYHCLRVLEYPDHHAYTSQDLDKILQSISGQDCSLVTTEKDMVRLLPLKQHALFQKHDLFYLPMRTVIQNNENFVSWLAKSTSDRLLKK